MPSRIWQEEKSRHGIMIFLKKRDQTIYNRNNKINIHLQIMLNAPLLYTIKIYWLEIIFLSQTTTIFKKTIQKDNNYQQIRKLVKSGINIITNFEVHGNSLLTWSEISLIILFFIIESQGRYTHHTLLHNFNCRLKLKLGILCLLNRSKITCLFYSPFRIYGMCWNSSQWH